LHGAGWVLWDERAAVVRLGPRAGGWIAADLTVLRELHRTLPPPEPEPERELEAEAEPEPEVDR
jgi:hypothetical protein